MPVQVTAIMIGVKDLARQEVLRGGLGCTIDQDYPSFVSLSLGDGSSSLALYEWDAAAADAGVSPEGSGFRGVSFHYIVPSRDAVDEVMGDAVAAGGSVVKEAAAVQWGGYSGYFSDPDGHLWKVATSASSAAPREPQVPVPCARGTILADSREGPRSRRLNGQWTWDQGTADDGG